MPIVRDPSTSPTRQVPVPRWLPVPRGPVGDSVARVTRALGARPCEPCEERKVFLNRFVVVDRTRR